MSKPIFYKGQAVGCLVFGEGSITVLNGQMVEVDFGFLTQWYHTSGAMMANNRPTLYPIDQYREIIANLPAPQPEAWKPKPGEWCWFWDDGNGAGKQPILSRFISIVDDSFQAEFYKWQYCAPFVGELPEHLKEVQP